MTRATLALAFGLAAVPGAWVLWNSTFVALGAHVSEPVAAVALIVAAAAVGAWLGVPASPRNGAAHGVGVALAASVVSRMVLWYGVRPRELGAVDDTLAPFHALTVATVITLVLAVVTGVALGVAARRRAQPNQPDTTSTS